MQPVCESAARSAPGWLLAGIMTAIACGSAARGDEGMWLFNNPPAKILKAKYGFEPDERVAGPSAARQRAIQLRRLRIVCVVQRPGDHQPPRRRRRLAKNQHEGQELHGDGFYAKTRDEEVKCADLELNVLKSIEDVTERVNAAVPSRRRSGRGGKGPPGDHEHHRAGIDRQDRAAQRRRHAVPRRTVPALPLQEVHRRAARVRPRGGQSPSSAAIRQLRVSPLQPRHLLLPRLRERQAREDRALSQVVPDGAADGELVFVSGHRARPIGWTRSPIWDTSATFHCPAY